MYMRNNKGPKMEPCDTPYVMVWISDLLLLMVAYWVRGVKYCFLILETKSYSYCLFRLSIEILDFG